jgi:hypothetical protein
VFCQNITQKKFRNWGENIGGLRTGKCLNAYSKYSGGEPFVWACNPADMDQNWEMLDKGNGYVLYRLKNTGMCLTADTPVGNSSIVALRDCAYNGANGTQDWRDY